MSALGQKRTFWQASAMAAFPPESGQARATNQQIVNIRAQWRRKRIY
jgi:hypothetical protein